MKLHKALFVRYLLRQRIIALIVSFVVCAITVVAVILASRGQTGVLGIILLVIIIAIWFFPLYLIVITLMNYYEFKKELKIIENDKEKILFDKMSNQLVRELVVKNGIKVNIFFDKKTDSNTFNQVMDEELKFHRKNLELLKGR